MPEIVPPQVKLVAWTQFQAPEDVPWSTDADGGQALAEFAGRACYQSWKKPNPATATNAGYLAHILEVGHLSVLEHGTVTLLLHRGVPLVHPRADPAPALLVLPAVPAVRAGARRGDGRAGGHRRRPGAAQEVRRGGRGQRAGVHASCWRAWRQRSPTCANPTLRRKQARQAARAILPNATETRIVVTGNYRAWRHFVGDAGHRARRRRDPRAGRSSACGSCSGVAPNVFADFTISTLPDGSEVAASPYAQQS